MLVRIIIGLIGVAIGFFMVWKAEKFVEAIGPMEWAEKFFGGSRSSTGYQAVGIVIILVSFMIMTNLLGAIFMPLVEKLFGGLRQ